MWTDQYIESEELFRLNDHQKISHFPGIDIFAKKHLLGKKLMKMSKYLPEQYDFFPMTWSIPSEYGDLKRYDEQVSIK
jgi:tubulin polyglutamylase TTLL6/13